MEIPKSIQVNSNRHHNALNQQNEPAYIRGQNEQHTEAKKQTESWIQ